MDRLFAALSRFLSGFRWESISEAMAKYNQRRDPSVVGAAEPPAIACAIAGDCPHHAKIQVL